MACVAKARSRSRQGRREALLIAISAQAGGLLLLVRALELAQTTNKAA
jgi:hypothetical protein